MALLDQTHQSIAVLYGIIQMKSIYRSQEEKEASVCVLRLNNA